MAMTNSDSIRTLAIDPGKNDTWFTLWEGRTLRASGQIITPTDPKEFFTQSFVSQIDNFMKKYLRKNDELVIERFMVGRGQNVGLNLVEPMNLLIATLAKSGVDAGASVVLYTPSQHKQSFGKFNTDKFPHTIIERLGKTYGRTVKLQGTKDPFVSWSKEQKFKSDKTGNEVKFGALPKEQKDRIRDEYVSKNQEEYEKITRFDPCMHVMDAATLGCYRILKRENKI